MKLTKREAEEIGDAIVYCDNLTSISQQKKVLVNLARRVLAESEQEPEEKRFRLSALIAAMKRPHGLEQREWDAIREVLRAVQKFMGDYNDTMTGEDRDKVSIALYGEIYRILAPEEA